MIRLLQMLVLLGLFLPTMGRADSPPSPGLFATGHFTLVSDIVSADGKEPLEGATVRQIGKEVENAAGFFERGGARFRAEEMRKPAMANRIGIAVLGMCFVRSSMEEAEAFDPKQCEIEIRCEGYKSRIVRLSDLKMGEMERADKLDSRIFLVKVALEKAVEDQEK